MRRYRTNDGSGEKAESRRPRHIRDIAHLYLSKKRNGEKPAPSTVTVNLLLTSGERSCFSGLHAANLAAAFCHRQADVRLFELSGVLPNASFYFSHPPRVYLNQESRSAGLAIPGLSGVTLSFDGTNGSGRNSKSQAIRVNLFHLPPAATIAAVAEEAGGITSHARGDRWGILLTRSTGTATEHCDTICRTLAPSQLLMLALQRGISTKAVHADVGDLGRLDNWERTLADRVPIVMRDPSSALSRAYMSICDSILGRVSASRRTANERSQHTARQPSRTSRW